MSSRTMMTPCGVVRREDLVPVCPHCEVELSEIAMRKLSRGFGVGRGFVFFCPQCRKTIGFASQWYPFPG